MEIDGAQASIDFSNDLRPHTVTDCSLVEGSILDPHETVTWAGGIQPSARISAP